MRIGSRGSSLARAQAEQVRRLLGGGEVVTIRTSGDEAAAAGTDGSGAAGGGAVPARDRALAASDKSRWVDAIEQALLAGEIDLAVHSAKDLPGELGSGLALLGAPARAPVADVLCGASAIEALPAGARVGTSSLRRRAQLLAARPDLEVRPLRGNVDTRLSKLAGEGLDAIVLAHAGLRRLGREQEAGGTLDPAVFVPSPGQGALALEGRAEDPAALQAAQAITDETTFTCLRAERALALALQASCNTPLGAWCCPIAGRAAGAQGEAAGPRPTPMRLRAWVGLPDGSAWITDQLDAGETDPETLASALAERMISVGAAELLAAAEAAAR